ncbi:MAG: hypothetical protein ACOX9C_01655 [Kiritimatiellia bacterium]|jgi:hypothetical protein
MRNQAFAFVKPHAIRSQAVATTLGAIFEDAGVAVSFTRIVTGPELVRSGVVDRHFGAVARGAAHDGTEPLETTEAGREAFLQHYDEAWEDACKAGRVVGADVVRERLGGIGARDLCAAWAEAGAVEVGPDTYVAWFEDAGCYGVNGFYPAIRESYLAPEAAVQLMLLDFEMPWREFHERVIGDERPEVAFEESIRGFLYDRAGVLEMLIDPVDNVIHASVSPLDALAEKMTWLDEAQWFDDPLLAALSAQTGLTPRALAPWVGAQVRERAVLERFLDMDTERVAKDLAAMMAG